MERLLTPNQVSDLFQVSKSLVYKWVHYRYVPHVKIGSLIRFKESQLLNWVKVKEKRGRKSINLDLDVDERENIAKF